MSNAKHTPGPWVKSIEYSEGGLDHVGICHHSPELYAGVGGFTSAAAPGSEEGQANISLILAAPDLLAACEQALILLINRTPQITEGRMILKKAIKKAKGEL